MYIAEFDEKITEPIEKDHTVLWVKPEKYVSKMFREWQRYIMERLIKERKKGNFMHRNMVTKKDLENKYIFWDIDGTLAAYRFICNNINYAIGKCLKNYKLVKESLF